MSEKRFRWQVHYGRTKDDVRLKVGEYVGDIQRSHDVACRGRRSNGSSIRVAQPLRSPKEVVDGPFGAEPEATEIDAERVRSDRVTRTSWAGLADPFGR